jgi:outer membrane protein TolC
MRTRPIESIVALFILISYGSLSAQVLTIDSCYEKAKRNYPLIKQYDLIEKSAEYNISNAGKSYLPQFSATAIAGYIIKGLPSMLPPTVESSEDKFQFIGIGQLNQTIWDGGATRTQKEIIKAGAEAEKAEVDVALHSIHERVNQLFFGILLMDEQLLLLNILTDNLNRNLKAVQLSNENGIAYSSDIDEVKVELLKVEQRIVEIRFVREGYVNMLAMMIGEPVSTNIKLEKPIVTTGLDNLTINRPELSLYQFQRNLVEAQSAISKVGNMPKIGLLGAGILIQPGVAFGTEKINSLAIAGLSVSWNTNSIYKSSNNRELTKISLDRISNQQETFVFNTRLQMTQQSSEIEKQRTIVAKDLEIVALKSAIKKAYEQKYQNGICSMNDLLSATNGETEAQSNQALHEAQLLLSVYTYKTTSGN